MCELLPLIRISFHVPASHFLLTTSLSPWPTSILMFFMRIWSSYWLSIQLEVPLSVQKQLFQEWNIGLVGSWW